MENIGIVGAGHVGEALSRGLVDAGYTVKVANSRGPESLRAFAQRTGAQAVAIAEVSLGVDVLVIAIPMAGIADVPKTVIATLPPGAIVVDAGNYYPLRDGMIPGIEAGLTESQWVAQQLGAPVVKAFNNIIASILAKAGKPAGDPHRIALPVAGDDPKARAAIMLMVESLGFDAVDAGLLSESWRQQPGQPAYCTDPTRGELPVLLQRADRKTASQGRDRAAKILSKLPSHYPADQLVRVSRIFVGLDKTKLRSWLAVLRLGVTLLRHPR